MDDKQMQEWIYKLVSEMVDEKNLTDKKSQIKENNQLKENNRINKENRQINEENQGETPDLSKVDFRKVLRTPHPANGEEFLRLKEKTPARLGIWRAGPRVRTEAYLRFRADHAAAMDAVFSDVDEKLLEKYGLFSIQSKCKSKDEFLTRPDLGAQLDEEAVATLKEKCVMNPDIQVYFSDGLSSASVEANIGNLLPAIQQGLGVSGLKIGTPFFVKYGRVRTMDKISEVLGAKVTAVCIGERPGLATSESLSVYMCYNAYVGVPEANRTVVSNIYSGGSNPSEAGALIAELLVRMYREKASGINFKI